MFAYTGKILKVDLSLKKVTKKPLSFDLLRGYIGGKGLGTYLLLQEIEPTIDPLGPDNVLIFCTGPATGTIIPHKGYILVYKSPLTGIYASSSSGGKFAADMKHAGYDVIMVKGRAEVPVFLSIIDDEVEIEPAGHLLGKDVYETNKLVKEDLRDDDVNILCIGPAGENLVRFAGIFNDYSRTAGRCGAGAVMGSKNLKAIAVRGTRTIETADMEKLRQLMRDLHITIDSKLSAYQQWGSAASVSKVNKMGVFPTRYYREQQFAFSNRIDAEAISKKVLVKSKACYSCPARCGKVCEVQDGPYKGAISELDFETIWAFGPLCANDNIQSIVKANELCDRFGLDTISTGHLIAFAIECYERKIISKAETEGIELGWGNHQSIIRMIEKIAFRKGVGDILANGTKHAAKELGKGAEKIAVQIKGLEPPAFDPRGLLGAALSFAVADRGGCHLPGSLYTLEVNGIMDPHDTKSKPLALKNLEDRFAVCDSFIVCRFVSREVYSWDNLVRLLPPLVGFEIKKGELMRIGERIITMTRIFNVLNGVKKSDDNWPERFYIEPISSGPMTGRVLRRDEFQSMIDEYYRVRDWTKNGIPKCQKIVELGLPRSPKIEALCKEFKQAEEYEENN